MMYRKPGILKWMGALLWVALLALPATAQQPRSSYTRKEGKLIEEAARKSLSSLQEYYNLCTDPDGLSQEEVNEALGLKFTGDRRIFFDKNFEVDDDTYADTQAHQPTNIERYLLTYKDRVKCATRDAISIDNISISDFYKGRTYNYLRVTYTLRRAAKTPEGKSLPDKLRERAEMQIIEEGNKFRALISGIEFAHKKLPDNEVKVPLTGGKADESDKDAGANMPAGYYQAKLEKGLRYTADNDFVKAYYALSEAKGPDAAINTQAGDAMDRLVKKMQQANFDNTEDLYNSMVDAARKLTAKNRYDEARRYYQHALTAMPIKSTEVSAALTALKAKADAENVWTALLDKEAYADAQKGLEIALRKDPKNVNLMIALARAQAGLGDVRGSETTFNAAIAEDAANPAIYLWQGRTLLRSRSFDPAYNAFVRYKAYAQEAALPEADAYAVYAKAMTLTAVQDYKAALDSLGKSSLPEASLESARIHITVLPLRDYGRAEKLLTELLRSNPAYADAHYWKGRLLMLTRNNDNAARNREAAMEEFKAALNYDTKNFAWYADLAALQTESRLYADALQTYNRCLENNPNAFAVLSLRGRCYYLLNRDAEAMTDFKAFFDKMPTANTPAVLVDYGRLLTRMGNYTEAEKQLLKAGNDKEALLALAVLNYVKNPDGVELYMNLFKRAFIQGVSQGAVSADPYIRQLYQSNRDFKKLLKEYKYAAAM